MSRTQTKVTLVSFSAGSKQWNYAGSEVAVGVGGITYAPTTLVLGIIKSRTKVRGSDSLAITIPKLSSLGTFIRARHITPSISVIVRTAEISSSGTSTLDPAVARGTVVAHQSDEGTLTLEVESIAQGLADIGLRKSYSKLCTHSLYGTACGADKSAHTVQAQVSGFVGLGKGGAVVSFVDTIGEEEEWVNGSLTFQLEGATIGLQIITNTENSATVAVKPRDIPIGTSVTIIRGCNLTFNVCDTVFSNHERFGGFPYFNVKLNPFEFDTFEVDNELNVFSFVDIPDSYFQEIK